MALITLRDLRKVLHPHYLVNIILSLSFILMRKIHPFCTYLFDSCSLNHKESEILFFAAIIIVFRTRKQGAVNFLPYIGTACMFSKLAGLLLWFLADPLYGVLFAVLCLLHLLLMPEPCYKGPENMTYFNGNDLEESIKREKGTVWLIELYAAWNPTCIEFAPTFSELSANYALDNLKFGKVELSRNPEVADKYKINTSPLSKQMPTLILVKNGKEEMRRPLVSNNGKLVTFNFNYANVVSTFDLNNLHIDCKKALKDKSKTKQHLKDE
ncbi:thioredoxin-related transmembrane protein 2 homolog [Tetranychus urticae]|uniref:Thioredoxin domain-containing protein n=1 Tax=Tetranychus urticae TaxID=32264 RepID=T1L218_TETUR|nr:thioredoxin-related transmembrane protein 2 homolog [Tetranychus urticae]